MKPTVFKSSLTCLILAQAIFSTSYAAAAIEESKSFLQEALPDAKLSVFADGLYVSTDEGRNLQIYSLVCKRGTELGQDPEKNPNCAVIAKSDNLNLNFTPAWFDRDDSSPDEISSKYYGQDYAAGKFREYKRIKKDTIHLKDKKDIPKGIVINQLTSIVKAFMERSKINVDERTDLEFRISAKIEEVSPDLAQSFVWIKTANTKYTIEKRWYEAGGETSTTSVLTFIPKVKTATFQEFAYNPFDIKRDGEHFVGELNSSSVKGSLKVKVESVGNGKSIFVGTEEIKISTLRNEIFYLNSVSRLLKKRPIRDVTLGDTLRVINAYVENHRASAFTSINEGKAPTSVEAEDFAKLPSANAAFPEVLNSFGDFVYGSASELKDKLKDAMDRHPDTKVTMVKAEPKALLPEHFIQSGHSAQDEYYGRLNMKEDINAMASIAIGTAEEAYAIVDSFVKSLR